MFKTPLTLSLVLVNSVLISAAERVVPSQVNAIRKSIYKNTNYQDGGPFFSERFKSSYGLKNLGNIVYTDMSREDVDFTLKTTHMAFLKYGDNVMSLMILDLSSRFNQRFGPFWHITASKCETESFFIYAGYTSIKFRMNGWQFLIYKQYDRGHSFTNKNSKKTAQKEDF